ncbi:SusD/RagB family nutrient-binding outer membrane lipoprotein [Pedobacter sp. SYP-B3415]|uniref:SusD/RagB family nutrient-binding outer membrane lipoprotein n=1 Tax=Pedobacter sp. SYP-B3415 TaxID=2496641 RepID=UPI00101CA787|nr:SusD/RagB family nutrient-binding outer membrane lipoprotein [Pedobacter sp. SYP-B3415]
MKKLSRYMVGALIGAVTLTGCEKNFLDVNNNPNQTISATPQLVLSGALNRTTSNLTLNFNQLGNLWAGYWAPPTDFLYYVNEKQYNVTSSFNVGSWETTYDILNDYQELERVSAEANLPVYVGIAKIMKAHGFQHLVDAYNNVPFSEALQATAVIRPKYEAGQTVYEGSLALIDAGMEAIKSAGASGVKPGSDDIFFGGNTTKWLKFANTLKLRMLIRQSEIPGRQAYITAEMAKIAAEGSGFIGAGESVLSNPGYINSSGKLNPFWERYYANAAGSLTDYYRATRPTVFVINKYQTNADPRLTRMYSPVAGAYKGVELGRNSGDADAINYKANVTSPLLPGGGVLKSGTQPTVILSSSESLFLQAEAVQRGWLTGDAQALYNSGVAESFVFLGVPNASAAAATYVAQPNQNVNFAVSANKIEAIVFQKWLSLNSISGWEAWNDFRRTGYPADNPLSVDAITPQHPVRLFYPNSELGTNGEEVAKQGALNPFESRVFWDVN